VKRGKLDPGAFYHKNVILDTLREVAKENNLYFESRPRKLEGDQDWGRIEVGLGSTEQKFFESFQLQQMPGCCAVLTMSYLRHHNPDAFDLIVQYVEEAAFRAGFGSMVLTQVWKPEKGYDREPWAKLIGRGWKLSEPFINAKSGNKVSYLTMNLGQDGKVPGLEEPVYDRSTR